MAPVLAIAAPTFGRLVEVLTAEKRSLRLLYDHLIRLGLLLAAGEHRFIARSLDEVAAIRADLGALELARAAICDTLVPSSNATLMDAVAFAPDDLAMRLLSVGDDLQVLSNLITQEQERCQEISRRRESLTRTAIRRIAEWNPDPDEPSAA